MSFLNVRIPLAALLAALVLSGCSWFGGDDEPEEIKPNPLPDIRAEVTLDSIWSRKVGKGAEDRAVRLTPAVVGGRIFAAAADGHVMAMTTDTGRVIWRQQVKEFYSRAELANAFTKRLDVITGGCGS